MKIKLLLFFLFFLFIIQSIAQTTFYRQYGSGVVQSGIGSSCVQQTFDGGYILTGFIYPSGSDAQVYLVKTNAIGDTVWTKIIGGMVGFFMGNFVQQTADSGYVITGIYQAGEVYLIRTNSMGDTLWTKHYGNSAIGVTGNSVQQTMDGGFIIVATLSSNSNDVYLIKIDFTGDTLWTKTFGGSNTDYGNSVQQTTDGGYIIAGETWTNTAGSSDAYLIKTNSNGDTLWTKKYGGTDGEHANEVRQTNDGGYVFCGGNGNIYVVKTDANGGIVWQNSYGGISHDDGFSIKQTPDNGYVIAGQIDHYSSAIMNYVADACLLKLRANGTQEWNRNFGPLLGNPSPTYGTYVSLTADGGYIMTGVNQFAYLIKTDSSGTILTTGISEYDSENIFSIFPNPANETLNILFSENSSLNLTGSFNDPLSVQLFNSLGVLLKEFELTKSAQLYIADLSTGLYFLHLKNYSSKSILFLKQ